jgi:ABC-type transporter Mla MlaB component
MSDKSPDNENVCEIACEESMDISIVSSYRTQFIEALASEKTIVLDGALIERADTAALQLLSVFFNDANAQQQEIRWKSPSEALCRSAAMLGLSKLLHLQTAMSDTTH